MSALHDDIDPVDAFIPHNHQRDGDGTGNAAGVGKTLEQAWKARFLDICEGQRALFGATDMTVSAVATIPAASEYEHDKC